VTVALLALGLLVGATPTPADFLRCPKAAKTCVGITFHVAHKGPKSLVPKPWIAKQLAHANRLFADIGLGFEVAAVKRIDANEAHVVTRLNRDMLGRKRFQKGTIHIFLVTHLANVDAPGVIRGVHWRDRGNVKRRWVILANYARQWVLAHELGHFFGLPHSRYPKSVMNKRPRKLPAAMDRVFVAAERKKMRASLRAQLRYSMVRHRQAPVAKP